MMNQKCSACATLAIAANSMAMSVAGTTIITLNPTPPNVAPITKLIITSSSTITYFPATPTISLSFHQNINGGYGTASNVRARPAWLPPSLPRAIGELLRTWLFMVTPSRLNKVDRHCSSVTSQNTPHAPAADGAEFQHFICSRNAESAQTKQGRCR